MKFEIGDKVTFKNEKLNGAIVDFLKSGKIKVMLDDGFDMDVLPNELIKIGETSKQLNTFFQKEEPAKSEETPIATQFGKDGEVNLITMPAEENQLLSGPVIFILENRTNYELPFSIAYKTKFDCIGITCGILKPQTQIEVGKYHRGDIKLWTNIVIEVLFFKTKTFDQRKPITKEVSIMVPELHVADLKFKGRNAFARLQPIVDLNQTPVDFEKLKNVFNQKQTTPSIDKVPLKNYASEIEIDLHIEMLTEKFSHLSNAEILEIQISHFRRELNIAIVKKLRKVIFIHGVGDGVLKNYIHKELHDYKGIRSQPAPIGKYGHGALEVIL